MSGAAERHGHGDAAHGDAAFWEERYRTAHHSGTRGPHAVLVAEVAEVRPRRERTRDGGEVEVSDAVLRARRRRAP